MPHRSLELFHHCERSRCISWKQLLNALCADAHYRIFNRTAVLKNPDSDWQVIATLLWQANTNPKKSVGMAFSSPGTFRAYLLMTALNYSWLSGPGSLQSTEMEETYLYHKLEAMRLVNEQIGDPVQSRSDGCLSMIAALALVEVRDPLEIHPWQH